MSFEAITNHREYLSAHYLAEVLPGSLKKGLLADWMAREKKGEATPRQGLRGLRQAYFAAKANLIDLADDDGQRSAITTKLHQEILGALGPTADRLDGGHLAVVEAGWADDPDLAAAGALLEPVQVDPRTRIETGFALASHLFTGDDPPRYVLILNGGVLTLADRHTWAEGRYLAASLDVAFGRNDTRPGGELDIIAALFSADSLLPPAEGGDPKLATVLGESRQHAVGVSSELREGLRQSVELIANEVLQRIRDQGVDPTTLMDPRDLARELGRESLRYLYRILFLLYAEARPELGVLPADDPDYVTGYSVARLGDLVSRKLGGEQARQGFHLYESLDLLFRSVNGGHHERGDAPVGTSEGKGIRFEPLRSDLFLPEKTKHIGRYGFRHPDDDDADSPRHLDTRLRNGTLYQVLRLLMLTRGKRKERGGFISYAQLGINQLGAVYEGLMSYSGFIAAEELYEVAKGGDAKDGSWMIPASKVDEYADDVFVTRPDENTGLPTRVRYAPGAFVYRLAGRDRQTSASYYTPQSLTEVTVQLALKYRLDQDGTTTPAQDLLKWTICEPALGSGAFLNEAINQVAAEYLRRRQAELDETIDPDQYATELQKVKAYIALHNCYGVDLNATAVELAEVSLWLNVMHRGLQAPWFGLHLRRGNSLIGGRRQYYTPDQLTDKAWLTTAPTDHPLRSEGPWPDGAIHHFLLPADGWGAVASESEARKLAPEDAKRLGDWRRRIKGKPDSKQVKRLQAIAGRVERLWDLVRQRLALSEQEIRRDIAVWGADDLPPADKGTDRDQIKADLEAEGSPYWRLKLLMDTWCALWFWPLDKAALLDGTDDVYDRRATLIMRPTVIEERVSADVYENTPLPLGLGEPEQPTLPGTTTATRSRPSSVIEKLARPVPLSTLDDWLTFAEAVAGRSDIPVDSLVAHFTTLAELDAYESDLPKWTGTDSVIRLFERFSWLETAHDITQEQGFFHWEIEFAQAFADGGFDLQVGNPPWVRPEWDEDSALAEYDPWFELTSDSDGTVGQSRKLAILTNATSRSSYIAEKTNNVALAAVLGSPTTYPTLVGTQPDVYRAFMCGTWRATGIAGTVGLVHPDTHFVGVREGRLRAQAYRRLRLHGGFVNAANWAFAPPIGRNIEFGVHIYGRAKAIDFLHLGQLYGAAVLTSSLTHDGVGDPPGQKHRGTWDLRPHKARVITVDGERLLEWGRLRGEGAGHVDEVQMIYPLSTFEQNAIESLVAFGHRLDSCSPRISGGYHEKGARDKHLIREQAARPESLSEVILQGTHLAPASWFAKEPNDPFRGGKDWVPIDLTTIADAQIPRTVYTRACEEATYREAQDVWEGRRYTERYRLAWRRRIDPKAMERSLFAALVPPGPAHVDAVHTMALETNRATALNAGFWASIPLDYLLRVTGRADLRTADTNAMPAAVVEHPLSSMLMLRTLRLNCLTRHYEDLWIELFDVKWLHDAWVVDWPGLQALSSVRPSWERATPLRAERERRSALVEIDALVSVWLGIGVEELIAVLRSRYPILTDREDEMWFDSAGRRIARDPYAFGFGQEKGAYEQLMKHLDDPDREAPPVGYTAPFYRADRENEYRQAHAVFSARLQAAKDAGWEPSA